MDKTKERDLIDKKFFPLISKMDALGKQERVIVAIDGGSGSGKTTLSSRLEQVYDCNVFHMDDFFLRKEQRTQERLMEVGGNVDWERFLSQVLIPLSRGETIDYVRFDCASFAFLPAKKIEPKKINIIEGSYSMHPKLSEMYDLGVFLDISSKLQEERIKKRNSPELAKRFLEEWIPMERRYHEGMQVKERCDLCIKID